MCTQCAASTRPPRTSWAASSEGTREPVGGQQVVALGGGLGDVQVQQQAVLAGRARPPRAAPAAARCRRRAGRCRTRPCRRPARRRPGDGASRSCSSIGGMPGSGISGVAITARAPVAPTAAAIRSGWKYISTLVVIPLPSISAEAAVIATSTSSGVRRASRGHMTSRSQRSSGSPSPCPRNSTIGACEWVFTSPGVSTPGSATTSAPPAGGALGGRPDPLDQPVQRRRRRHRGRRCRRGPRPRRPGR